ncbi:MAG TPA: GntR family transcriptional regulator [Gemmataceae bacterium]|nr:GntR family transcriptional regulator [Gemmataceae bacterium]
MPTRTPPEREARFDHGRRRQAIVRSVLTDVFQGRIRAGERLVTQTLADRFGVSHTPIREALIELSGLGIVDLLPNRGAVVKRVTARAVREVSQVRRVLECEAVRGACGRIDPVALDTLAAEIGRVQTVDQARDTDNRLHDLIAANCGNTFLTAELSRLMTLFRAFRDVAWEQEQARADFARIGVEVAEHLAVLDGLRTNDRKAAGRAMAAHVRSTEGYWARVTARLDKHSPRLAGGAVDASDPA